MSKKSILMILALVLCLGMTITGTLAYLTSTTDVQVNTMVLGNVKIEQYETDEFGNAFVQNQYLLPAVGDNNKIAKEVYVKNTGSIPAYVRTTLTFEMGTMTEEEFTLYVKYELGEGWTQTKAGVVDGDYVVVATYNNVLPAGATTTPSLTKVWLDSLADNEQVAKLGTDPYTVVAFSQAVQAEGFVDANEALSVAFDGAPGINPPSTPSTKVDVADQAAFEAAIAAANGPTVIVLSDADTAYTLPNKLANKNITFRGTKNAVINAQNVVYGANDSTIAFEGVTVKFGTENYRGLQHAAKVEYKNCTIEGKQFLYAPVVEFTNCKLVNKNDYSVWTYGANKVDFNNCEFISGGKAVLVYNEMKEHVANITLKNCSFTDDNTLDTVKAAVETGITSGSKNKIYLNFENCTVEGFAINNEGPSTGSTLYGNKNNMDFEHLIVTIDDAALNNTISIATAEELFAFAKDVNENGNNYAGKTVKLTADINLANKAWTPIGQTGATEFKGVFDGNGHTIYNLSINNTDDSANCATGLFGWIEDHGQGVTIKNLKVSGATVQGHHNVAVIAGYLIGTVENCHVTNATVVCTHVNDDACGDKAGVIAGIAAGEAALIKNCTASASTVKAGRDAGQIVGACIIGKVEGCSASNVTVSVTGECTGANVNDAIIGRTN